MHFSKPRARLPHFNTILRNRGRNVRLNNHENEFYFLKLSQSSVVRNLRIGY